MNGRARSPGRPSLAAVTDLDVPLRVCVVHPGTDLYGSDRMVLRTVQALAAGGARVDLRVPATGTLTGRLDELGVTWQRVDFPVLRRTLLSPRGLLELLRRLLTSLPAVVRAVRASDVVYVNTVSCGVWLAVAALLGVPSVCHVRENEPQMGRAQRRLLLAPLLCATAVLANSRSTLSWTTGTWPRLAGRARVVYNGLDLPAHALADPLSGPGPVRLLVVGRLSGRKGQEVAVRALARLRDGGADAVLSLVGDHYPGYEDHVAGLHALVAGLHLQDRVDFAGFRTELDAVWAAGDVALVPSLLEPFGNVAVEAMAAGLPVVASAVQGLTEIITPGRTGWLVPPGDDALLAAAVAEVLADPVRSRAVAAAGAAEVRERFALARYDTEVTSAIGSVTRR